MFNNLNTDILFGQRASLHVLKELLKLNNTLNNCLIMLSIVSYYYLSLNVCECLICQMYQQNCNRLENHTYFNVKILL